MPTLAEIINDNYSYRFTKSDVPPPQGNIAAQYEVILTNLRNGLHSTAVVNCITDNLADALGELPELIRTGEFDRLFIYV